MKLIFSMIILPFILGINFLSCEQVTPPGESYAVIQKDNKQYSHSNKMKVEDILSQTESTYFSFNYYKSKGQNIYTKKGISEEVSTKKLVEIEYSFPSQIKTILQDEKGESKTLISENNSTFILSNEKEVRDFDDLYWGLTSTEFGDGTFFEVAKILVLKERNRNLNSIFQNLDDVEIVGEEEINEKYCYKIQGTFKTDKLITETFWIDKNSFLIIQFERLMMARKVPGGYSKTVESYNEIEAR